jgi:hypothetical protein
MISGTHSWPFSRTIQISGNSVYDESYLFAGLDIAPLWSFGLENGKNGADEAQSISQLYDLIQTAIRL